MPEKMRVEISEVVYLKIMLAHAQEEILSLRELKLSADEEVLRLFRKRLELETRSIGDEINKTYAKFGVTAGDEILNEGGKFFILKSLDINNLSHTSVELPKPSIPVMSEIPFQKFPEPLKAMNSSSCPSLEEVRERLLKKVPELNAVKPTPTIVEKQKEKDPNVNTREQ